MKVLVWNSLWQSQGDPFFFKNCFVKHLHPQARSLSTGGFDVDVAVPAWFMQGLHREEAVNYIEFEYAEALGVVNGLVDPHEEFYRGNQYYITSVAEHLATKLSREYDVVLLWENPAPYLETLYPNSVIIHQMPGFFSRPPYPHTVAFDVKGLYRNSSLASNLTHLNELEVTDSDLETVRKFKNQVRQAINEIQPFDLVSIGVKKSRDLTLLPLQTSAHYAFAVDSKWKNQQEVMLSFAVQQEVPRDIIVTQYVSLHASEQPLDQNTYQLIKKSWPNIIYDKRFDEIGSSSQYLLPLVDSVAGFSSSLLIQALAWDKKIYPLEGSYLSEVAKYLNNGDGNSDRFLAILLKYLHPLASKVTTDGAFLRNLLEKLVKAKTSAETGKKLYINFSDVCANYDEELLESFRPYAVSKTLLNSNPIKAAEANDLNKFKKAVAKNTVDIVSFDIFDTLVCRGTETPADVYNFLESLLIKKIGWKFEGFYKVRISSELKARAANPQGEISLNDIYTYVGEHYSLDANTLREITEYEIELELQLIRARPFGKKLWNIARESAKNIIFVSDMYHSHEFVSKVLRGCGYLFDEDKLFVSSNYNKRKKTGELFDEINSQGHSLKRVLHVGDNKAADHDIPKSKGCDVFRIPRSIDRMRRNSHYKKLFNPRVGSGEKSRSAVAGMLSYGLFDQSSGKYEERTLFMKSAYRLGYAALGPLLFGYATWLKRKAESDGIDTLYFLAREGKVIKSVFDLINENVGEVKIKTHYLYCSRRAVRVAAIRSIDDVISIAAQPFSAGVALSKLIKDRFGYILTKADLDKTNVGFFSHKQLDYILNTEDETKVSFVALCRELADKIIQSAKVERAHYLEYLSSVGFADQRNPAVVDIGWKANMQGALSKLIDKPVYGYYFATLQGAERWELSGNKLSSYGATYAGGETTCSIVNNRHLTEFLLCCSDRSLESISFNKDGLDPVFKDDGDSESRRKFIDVLHHGAVAYTTNMVDFYGSVLEFVQVNKELASEVISHYFSSPTVHDAEIISQLEFEDSFGGVVGKKIVSLDGPESVWPQGKKVLSAGLAESSNNANTQPRGGAKTEGGSKVLQQSELGIKRRKRLLKLENFIVRKTSTDKQYNKYLRDPGLYFSDSALALFRWWAPKREKYII